MASLTPLQVPACSSAQAVFQNLPCKGSRRPLRPRSRRAKRGNAWDGSCYLLPNNLILPLSPQVHSAPNMPTTRSVPPAALSLVQGQSHCQAVGATAAAVRAAYVMRVSCRVALPACLQLSAAVCWVAAILSRAPRCHPLLHPPPCSPPAATASRGAE